jgi:glycosyltransferase involved in cell wall biosynthesis
MRILLCAYACDPSSGSEPGSGWNWARELCEAGHDVWVLTGAPGTDRVRRSERARKLVNLHIIDVPTPLVGRLFRNRLLGVYLHYLGWLWGSYRLGAKLISTRPFDVVHHVSWGSLFWGSPMWRLGLPFVFGPIGGGQVAPTSLRPYFGPHWKRERVRSWILQHLVRANPLARSAARHAAIVLVTNTATAAVARGLGATRVHLIADTAVPPNLTPSRRSTAKRDDALEILWLARLLPIKGLALAFDALSRVAPDVHWKCTVVGGGPLESAVPDLIDRYGISDRTVWLGPVPWMDIGPLYDRADVFLFTSLRDSLGSQLFEAAAFGLPIVALDHHGVADFIPDCVADKVRVGTPEQTARGLAHAIERLARQPKRRQSMRHAARSFAQHNTWRARVEDAYSIIERRIEDPSCR